MFLIEIAVVLLLIAVNGVLAMSELAVVSSRPARLKILADRGRRGAAAAMALNADPGRFLSSVQIGITLVGILSGAFGGATLGRTLGELFIGMGMPANAAQPVAVGIVVAAITYISLIIGELVPKQLALRNPESVASSVAPAMRGLATVAAPVVWLLDVSGKAVLSLFGPVGDISGVTEDEIRAMVAEGETAGVVEPEERRMISAVLRLGDRSVRAVMTPRHEVEWVDLDDPRETLLEELRATRHSRLPVARGSLDEVEGIAVAKNLLDTLLAGGDPAACIEPSPVVIDTLDALDALETLRRSPLHVALVHDEYGQFEGVITSFDLLEAIVGSFPASHDGEGSPLVRRGDGSYLVDGLLPVDDLSEQLGAEFDTERGVQSVAGMVISALRHLPEVGEVVEIGGYRFEVVDLDGRRVDKVLVAKLPQDGPPASS